MNCPVCGGETKITHGRSNAESVERRRCCEECGYKFTTMEYEINLINKLIELKKDGDYSVQKKR